MGSIKKCRASALLTALALLVTAASIVTLLITTQRVSIRRTEALLHTSTLFYKSTLVDAWATQLLIAWQKNKTLVYEWPVVFPEQTLEGVTVQGKIEDWQGKFNIASLTSPPLELYFNRVLSHALPNVEPARRQSLAQSIIERVRMRPLLVLPSELMALEEFSAADFAALHPWIALLPRSSTKLNINSINGELLRALIDELSETEAEQFVSHRQTQQGFKSVSELQALFPEYKLPANLFTEKSNYFLVTAILKQDDLSLTTYSLLHTAGTANRPLIITLWRSWNSV